MNNTVLGETMENVWKNRDIKLLINKKRYYLVSELSYHKQFSEKVFINKQHFEKFIKGITVASAYISLLALLHKSVIC